MINKVFLIGNLGADPELRYTQKGNAVCNLRIATNESFKNSEGEYVERTEWHRIVVWNKQGEAVAAHKKKGHSVHVEGRLQTREWEDKEGNKRYTTEVVADNVTFLGSKDSQGQGQGYSKPQRGNQQDMPPF